MTDVLIRGLSDEAVRRIDAEALALGLSRNEFLRRKLEHGAPPRAGEPLSAADWARSSTAFPDLGDPDVMDAAWQ